MKTKFTLDDLLPDVYLFHSPEKFRAFYKVFSGSDLDRDLTMYSGFHTTGPYKNKLISLVYLDNDPKRSLIGDYTILIHEATHVKQALMDFYDEKKMGRDSEAIFQEYLSKSLMRAHKKWLKKKGIKK